MRRSSPTLLMACLVPALGAPTAVASADLLITASSIPPVEIGMDIEAVRSALPDFEIEGETDGTCIIARTGIPDLDMMFEDGKLTRVYVTDPEMKTAEGIHVESTEAEVRTAYGDALKVEPGYYDESWNVMTLLDGEGNGIVFDADGSRVATISIGTETALGYVEGCS